MKVNPYEMGRVVVSRQGHDQGRRFLVVGLVDERFVLIAMAIPESLTTLRKSN